MDSKTEHKLKKLIKLLKGKRGRHTELITVYVPAGFDLNLINSQIANEQGTATNIKDRTTKKNVVDALEKVLQHLRLYDRTPKNGLVLFCGNVSERVGQQDLQIWAIEPPDPIGMRLYRCDQTFITEPLEDLVTPKDTYGLIAIDNRTATIATLTGERYVIVKKLTSGYHGKHRAGGQSHRRFERLIAEQSHEFKVRVGETVSRAFLDNLENIRGIVVGGPAGTKDEFLDGPYLHHEIKKLIIAVKDITYTDESGIRELINASQDDLQAVEIVHQKTLMQRFMKGLVGDGAIAYGPDVDKALDVGAVDILLLSENLEEDLIDSMYELAEAIGAEIQIVSEEFEEGFQLWNTFGGKAALLRYKIA